MLISSEIIKNIASFLPNKERHKISFLDNYKYSVIASIITYSYNEYIKYQH
jgi:hypothetical protein